MSRSRVNNESTGFYGKKLRTKSVDSSHKQLENRKEYIAKPLQLKDIWPKETDHGNIKNMKHGPNPTPVKNSLF